ncbi:MAG: glycosyltransferase family 4 protein [Planctomycetota bacterium]|nr:glycosyltransferase family 4 protein [Planctomycetota bacterium]
MRRAFARAGSEVLSLDQADGSALRERLESEHASRPLHLVYERYALGAYATGEFARAHAVPYVLEVNAPLLDEEARHRPGQKSTHDPERERDQFAGASRVLCVSSDVQSYALLRGAPPAFTVVQPNAVDPEIFRPRTANDPLRAELVPEGRVAIGFHGRLRPWHGFDRLVAAFGRLVERGLPVHLLILGEGPFEEHLLGRVAAERITRLGWKTHEEAARVVACTDVLPLCYAPGEPCYFSPLKLLEAMACTAVPVVPALGDLPREVEHGVDGIVYDPKEQDALEHVLAMLVSDAGLRARLGRAARARAETRTWAGLAAQLLDRVPARGLA